MESIAGMLDEADDWRVVTSFLPEGWREKARELGALRRCRRFENAEPLLRTLMIHLADGCSLRETAVRARYGGIAEISDVALLKRLKASGEWLRWMAKGMMGSWIGKQPSAILGKDLNLRIIDGSSIQEPGSTGSSWRIHYSIQLPSLQCDEVHVTSPKVGESFRRFTVHPGDLFLGDRGFAQRGGIRHVVDNGGDVLVRIGLTSLQLREEDGSPFQLLARLRTLTGISLGDWDAWIPQGDSLVHGRVCAIRKNKQAIARAQRKARRDSNRKGQTIRPETIEAAQYTFVFTSLDQRFGAGTILEMYRGRWQIELVFKRLKSIIGLGHLKKADLEAAKAWIHGKLLVAFLVEALLLAGERFFPWGHPLWQEVSEVTLSLEGNVVHASSS